jgi:Methylamine utilisation protein MauE
MIDPLIPRIIAVGFGLMWFGAAWHKFASHQSFRTVLDEYQLLPTASLAILSWLVPIIEATLAIAWFFAFVPAITIAATSALLAAYATAIAINLWRGRADIGCGCGFSPVADDQPLSWMLVLRNLLLLAAALVPLLPQAQRSLGIADHALLVLALLVTALLHIAVMQLLRNRRALHSWSVAHD